MRFLVEVAVNIVPTDTWYAPSAMERRAPCISRHVRRCHNAIGLMNNQVFLIRREPRLICVRNIMKKLLFNMCETSNVRATEGNNAFLSYVSLKYSLKEKSDLLLVSYLEELVECFHVQTHGGQAQCGGPLVLHNHLGRHVR